jgi:hypothetical protein
MGRHRKMTVWLTNVAGAGDEAFRVLRNHHGHAAMPGKDVPQGAALMERPVQNRQNDRMDGLGKQMEQGHHVHHALATGSANSDEDNGTGLLTHHRRFLASR